MGQFSWLDCDMKNERCRQIIDNTAEDVYVLVPKEYGGGHILETEYDGYGNFGGHDIFDLVADWNRDYISEDIFIKPVKENYGGLWEHEIKELKEKGVSEEEIQQLNNEAQEKYFEKAMNKYNVDVDMLVDFKSGKDDSTMATLYGTDWKRLLGIKIACYDYQNASLKYPIKITHNLNLTYEEANYSLSDPNQGWLAYKEEYDEHLEEYVEEIDKDYGLDYALSQYELVDKKLEEMKAEKDVSKGKTR